MSGFPDQIVSVGPIAFAAVFAVIGLLSLVVLVPIIVVVSNRAEPDARGMRPFSVYLFGMSFFTLNLAYAGLTLIVTALLSFISPHYAPISNSVAREVVIGGLVLLIAGGMLGYHLQQGIAAARGDGRVDGPNARVLHSYIGVVSFVYVFWAMVSLGISIYLIFELIGPGVFGGGGSRAATLNTLLDLIYILVASVGIVTYMARLAPPGMLRLPTLMARAASSASAPPPPPPAA